MAEEPRRCCSTSDALNFTDGKLSPSWCVSTKDLILSENETLRTNIIHPEDPQDETEPILNTTTDLLQNKFIATNPLQQDIVETNSLQQNSVVKNPLQQNSTTTDSLQQNIVQNNPLQQQNESSIVNDKKLIIQRLRRSFSETDITNICMDPLIKLNDEEEDIGIQSQEEDEDEEEIQINIVDLDVGGQEKTIKIRTPISLKCYKKFCSYSPKVNNH